MDIKVEYHELSETIMQRFPKLRSEVLSIVLSHIYDVDRGNLPKTMTRSPTNKLGIILLYILDSSFYHYNYTTLYIETLQQESGENSRIPQSRRRHKVY